MAIAEQQTSSQAAQTSSDKSWHGIVLQTLKRNEISLVPYVPDRVLTPLIKNLHADPFFTTFADRARGRGRRHRLRRLDGRTARRGADADLRLCHARQRAGLARRALPDPADHVRVRARHARRIQLGQSLVCRTMRPVLDSLALEHHTITRLDELEFIADRSIKQAVTTQAPVALILIPLLTGGKMFDK